MTRGLLIRIFVKLAVGLAAVAGLRVMLGPWATALVVASVGVAGVIAGWALAERKMFPDPLVAPPLEVVPYRPSGDRQVVVLGECEDGVFRAS